MKIKIILEDNLEKSRMLIEEGMFVNSDGKIVKKDITKFLVNIEMMVVEKSNEKIIRWEIIDVTKDRLNADEDFEDLDYTLEGIIVVFITRKEGSFLEIYNKESLFYQTNINNMLANDWLNGMSPDQEELNIDFLHETFSSLDMLELHSFIKSLHNKYGTTYTLGEETKRSQLKRKIAKEHIPAIEFSKSKIINGVFDLSVKKKIDMKNLMKIFDEKDELAFKPFVKQKLRDSLLENIFSFEEQENIKYDMDREFINYYRKAGIYVAGTKRVVDFVSYKVL